MSRLGSLGRRPFYCDPRCDHAGSLDVGRQLFFFSRPPATIETAMLPANNRSIAARPRKKLLAQSLLPSSRISSAGKIAYPQCANPRTTSSSLFKSGRRTLGRAWPDRQPPCSPPKKRKKGPTTNSSHRRLAMRARPGKHRRTIPGTAGRGFGQTTGIPGRTGNSAQPLSLFIDVMPRRCDYGLCRRPKPPLCSTAASSGDAAFFLPEQVDGSAGVGSPDHVPPHKLLAEIKRAKRAIAGRRANRFPQNRSAIQLRSRPPVAAAVP